MAELEAKEAERKQTLRHAEVLAKQIDAHGKKERELLAVNVRDIGVCFVE